MIGAGVGQSPGGDAPAQPPRFLKDDHTIACPLQPLSADESGKPCANYGDIN